MNSENDHYSPIAGYYRAWVPNLFETMSHCPIDDSEMSQCANEPFKKYTILMAHWHTGSTKKKLALKSFQLVIKRTHRVKLASSFL